MKYTTPVDTDLTASFILPKKPANLLRGVLPREVSDIQMEFDNKNVLVTLKNYTLICRLIEGVYPEL